MNYDYGPGSYNPTQLLHEIVAAGLPQPLGIGGTGYSDPRPGTPATNIVVEYPDDLTALQKVKLDNTVAAHVPEGPRQPRPLYVIYNDIQALSVGQFSN